MIRKCISIGLVSLSLFIAACSHQPSASKTGQYVSPKSRICTQDAKICPNGAAVGRDPMRGCTFYMCPDKRPYDVVDECAYCEEE